ncbi:uncharacterized protein LOC124182332 isoform X1 [Neodiprion fabricii]|uniref:uncharacterized protein LOC124182332 isoform X1 n=1 Tax=Neodiprion fabricii TaxID=2872261 RepID=UPI001ED8DA44|nr:uncharacterized protein LOC124182332 isoform X1 [Neodiprion fabricii]
MLAPPVAQGPAGRPVGGAGVGAGGLGNRGQQQSVGPAAALWPLTPTQSSVPPNGQSQGTPPLPATPAPAHTQGVNRYGLYSLFPGSNPGGYVAATPATPGPPPARAYHATTHKVSESVFSAAVGVGVGVGGYTWGAPTPPPGSPYSPGPVTQLELLAKNLASLAPPAQQALGLQGVGVNVGSLHHAQHTQHTQHTLNLAGLHHLHHGGIHQSAGFSPQLSLVTGSAPALTINSFSSPNSAASPTTGVLLQDYQSPISSNTISCPTSLGTSTSGPVNGATTSGNAMLIQGTTYQGIAKRREAFLPSQGQPIKLENKSRQPCVCRNTNGKTKVVHSDAGCSRTLPIVSSWNGQQDNIGTNCSAISSAATLVKREPITSVPCQVAEVSTSLHATATAVKIEPLPPKSENGIVVSNSGSGIPVGIAVARQRLQHQETSSSTTRNVSLSHHTSHHASYHHFQPDNMGGAAAMTVGGATLVHCGAAGEDRPAHLTIPSATLPPGLNAALNSSLNATLGSLGNGATTATAWPHTFWQYPTAAMPMDPVGFPQMGIGGLQGGLQLVRDPSTGHLLLIHATAEQVQQAVVWPNYAGNNGGNVGPPPLLLPPPPPPSLQLLSDIGGARIVLTDNKRKQQNNLPIVKIEADCSNSPTTIITSAESTKALQTVTSMSGALIPDSPLVTTLHYYPHAPALVQISQAEPAHCRSQATSPVSCLTPPPESTPTPVIETPEVTPIGVQDASNQTDSPDDEELPVLDAIVKQEQNLSPCQMHGSINGNGSGNANTTNFEIVSSPEKFCNNIVKVASVNGISVSNVVGKVEKNDNTSIGVTDSPRYPTTSPTRLESDVVRSITSVDRTIEHVVNCHGQEEKMVSDLRSGLKIIEITEENCDSFHENLEFFSRRRSSDHSVKVSELGRTQTLPVEERKEKGCGTTNIVEVRTKVETVEAIAVRVDELKVENSNVSTKKINFETSSKGSVQNSNCVSCHAKLEAPSIHNHSDVVKKSFDMPSIDAEEQNCKQVVVKMEKDDTFTDCIYSQKLQPQMQPILHHGQLQITEKSKCQERISEPAKRHSAEKYHPGIENVVEKLKKNAAAALQDIRKSEDDEQVNRISMNTENHLRVLKVEDNGCRVNSGENMENVSYVTENGDTFNERVKCEEKNDHLRKSDETGKRIPLNNKTLNLKRPENHSYNSPKKNYVFNNYTLNNNIEEQPDNDISSVKSESLVTQPQVYPSPPKKEYVSKISAVKSGAILTKDKGAKLPVKSTKSNVSKVKLAVDLSGLELLSNSIEQFEHLKPGFEAARSQEAESGNEYPESPTKLGTISPQSESNNNNVESPLGLLCALAEQRFMEEVVGDEPKKSSAVDNSEEVSHAGRLLLNLGKGNAVLKEDTFRVEKRKHSENGVGEDESYEDAKKPRIDESSKNSLHKPYEESAKRKQTDEPTEQWHEFKEKTRRQIDFSNGNFLGFNTAKKEEDEKIVDSSTDRKAFKPSGMNGQERGLRPVKNFEVENGRVHGTYKKKYEYYIRNSKDSIDERCRDNDFTDSEAEQNAPDGDRIVSNNKHSIPENGSLKNVNPATIDDSRDSHHRYRSQQAEVEAKKFIARKGQPDGDTEWPNMDAMELDMRVKLADIQKKYKEKQKELSRLTPKKDDKKGPGRPRRKSHSSSSECDRIISSSPPLEVIESPQKSRVRSPEAVSPPLTTGVVGMPRCNVNLVKLGEPRSHIKLLDSIPSIPIPVPPVASPITVLPTSTILQDTEEKSLTRLEYDTSSPAPTLTGLSSASKKRKVGRPRKLMCASGSIRHLTETIVAKKPKSKASLVSYLLAAKNRHLQNKLVNKTGYTPLPFKSSGVSAAKANTKVQKTSKNSGKGKSKPAKQTPLHNKSVISSIIAEKEKFSTNAKLEKQVNKVKPKLKAEAKLKTWKDDENGEWSNVAENIPPSDTSSRVESAEETKVVPVEKSERDKDKHEKSKKKKRKSCSSSPKRRKSGDRDTKDSKRRKSMEYKECKECAKVAKTEKSEKTAERTESVMNRCKLTSAHLAIDQLRVLTAMGGLFYAGRLSAVEPPDVYAITLDGERGNRPHIHPREEIFRDAIVEVCPASTSEITPGTRLCAYWSQQYRCLYPGTSVESSEPDPELDAKFVSVEFDDGDSGRIALDDIRLLQPDYPVVEYDPNPLLTLGKRRRQTSSSTEEKRVPTRNQQQALNAPSTSREIKPNEPSKTEDADSKVNDDYRERKRLKKRRKDKLKRLQDAQDGKKKHKKHNLCEEHRKHKHRKHRKHRHRHSHHSGHSSHSEASHHSGAESCSGQKSEEESSSHSKVEVEAEIQAEEKQVAVETPQQILEDIVEEDEEMVEEKQDKSKKNDKKAKPRERQESVESRSKMAAFLPARQLWGWAGKGYRRPGAKGRAKKQFYKAIKRGNETIQIGDSAVFLSTGRPDRPYIGRIKSMWETSSSNMIVKVKWFYHPEETVGCPTNLKYPGALFESPHTDENDVQTISHKCEVLPLEPYAEKLSKEPHRYLTIYDNNDIYYLAGYYDPTTYLLNMQPGVV